MVGMLCGNSSVASCASIIIRGVTCATTISPHQISQSQSNEKGERMRLYCIWPGQLWQGGRTNPRPMPLEQKLTTLRESGITIIVALHSRKDDDVAAVYGNNYIWSPIPDSANAPFQKIERLADFVAEKVRSGDVVLSSCNMGRNRSSLLSIMLLNRLHNMPVVDAISHVRQVRPNALATPAFEEYLYRTYAVV